MKAGALGAGAFGPMVAWYKRLRTTQCQQSAAPERSSGIGQCRRLPKLPAAPDFLSTKMCSLLTPVAARAPSCPVRSRFTVERTGTAGKTQVELDTGRVLLRSSIIAASTATISQLRAPLHCLDTQHRPYEDTGFTGRPGPTTSPSTTGTMVLGVVSSGRLDQLPDAGHQGRIGSGQLPTLDRLRIGSGQLPTRAGAWPETKPRWAAAEAA